MFKNQFLIKKHELVRISAITGLSLPLGHIGASNFFIFPSQFLPPIDYDICHHIYYSWSHHYFIDIAQADRFVINGLLI